MPQHRLRHVQLFPTNFNPAPGLRVEGDLHDCWWPGEVVEQHYRKGWRICFDDGDTAWLVRRNVRPMLRRFRSRSITGDDSPTARNISSEPEHSLRRADSATILQAVGFHAGLMLRRAQSQRPSGTGGRVIAV